MKEASVPPAGGDPNVMHVETLAPAPGVQGLTARELDILNLLAEGLESKVVAERLGVSAEIIRAHVEHIVSKLGLRSGARVPAADRQSALAQIERTLDELDASSARTDVVVDAAIDRATKVSTKLDAIVR